MADLRDQRAKTAGDVATAARGLGASACEESWPAPWVICGMVDERAFYIRERSDTYKVVIAPDEHAGIDVWRVHPERGVTIATGAVEDPLDSEGTESPARAVHVAVAAVRTYLRRRGCAHLAVRGDRYCRACWLALVDPATQ